MCSQASAEGGKPGNVQLSTHVCVPTHSEDGHRRLVSSYGERCPETKWSPWRTAGQQNPPSTRRREDDGGGVAVDG